MGEMVEGLSCPTVLWCIPVSARQPVPAQATDPSLPTPTAGGSSFYNALTVNEMLMASQLVDKARAPFPRSYQQMPGNPS